MALHPKIIRALPLSAATKLEWRRNWLELAYAKDIAIARKAKDKNKLESLESERRFELDLHDEEDDTVLTKALLAEARRLRVPVPHRYNNGGIESDSWYQGQHTGAWCLTRLGVASLREDIRKELKAQHESRTQWVTWISALTGIVGAATGLAAILGHRP